MNLRELSMSQLAEVTGLDRRTVKDRLKDVKPLKTHGKAIIYDAPSVLTILLGYSKASDDDNRKALLEAELKYEQVRAEKVQLELEKLKQEVVPIEDVQKHWAEIATKTKNKVLGISSKIKQRHPEISMEVFASLEASHWEALEELANESNSEVHANVLGSLTASEET